MCLYKLFGVQLPEFSGAQAEVGMTVDEDTIRPGDLIFYVGRYPGVIGHVAIYIGNGKIIHAASESKGICVSSWKYGPPNIFILTFAQAMVGVSCCWGMAHTCDILSQKFLFVKGFFLISHHIFHDDRRTIFPAADTDTL